MDRYEIRYNHVEEPTQGQTISGEWWLFLRNPDPPPFPSPSSHHHVQSSMTNSRYLIKGYENIDNDIIMA